ncbi:MAG: hypothetical protein ACE5KU_04795 [Nitrososphaerales archaeon]
MKYTYIQPPFASKSMDRETFTLEAEIASVFCLAEERRKKKGFLSGTEENFASLLKSNYPVYAIRWRDRCILLDGLGLISEYVIYRDVIDVERFLEDLSKASKEVGLIRAFLTRNAQVFREFGSSRRMKLNHVISDVMLLSELTDFVKKSSSVLPPKETSVCFRVDRQMAEQIVSEFDTLVKRVEQDIESLETVDKSLLSSIEKAKHKILDDKENEFEKYNRELERLKPVVEKKIEELRRAWDDELQSLMKAVEKESEAIREEKQRCERDVEKMTRIEEECIEEKKALSQRVDRVGEEYWSREAERNKAQVANLWKTIKTCSERLEKIQFKLDAKVKRLKDRYEKQIRGEEEKLKELELSRDSAKEIKDLIIKELERRYSLISEQISRLIEDKRKDRQILLNMTTSWAPEKNSVLLVPLYLAKYDSEGRKRYDAYAPAIVNSYTAFKKVRRAFLGLESKISHLLTPIGKEFDEFFTKGFLRIMSSNRKFEEVVLQASSGTNLFENPDRGKIFGAGLDSLKSEGWLTEEEYKRMLYALNLSFKMASKTGLNPEDHTPE